jgi:hypothetical protein
MPLYYTDPEEQPRLDFVSRNRQRGLSQQSNMLQSTESNRQNNMLANAMSLSDSLKGLRNSGPGTNAEMANFPGARTAPRKINEMAAYPGARTAPRTPLAQAGKPDTILGMDRFKFAQLAGGLGSAIAGNTPLGRAGAVASQFAGQQIKRQEELADTAAERQAQIAADRRKFGHQRSLEEYKAEEDKELERLKQTYEKPLQEARAGYYASEAEQNKLQTEKIRVGDFGVEEIDGVLWKVRRKLDGTVVPVRKLFPAEAAKLTDPNYGQADRSTIPRASYGQIVDTLGNIATQGIYYDDTLKTHTDTAGNPVSAAQVNIAKEYGQQLTKDTLAVMKARDLDVYEAADLVMNAHANKAAKELLTQSKTQEELMVGLQQYPFSLHDKIQAAMNQMIAKLTFDLKASHGNIFTDTENETEKPLSRTLSNITPPPDRGPQALPAAGDRSVIPRAREKFLNFMYKDQNRQ